MIHTNHLGDSGIKNSPGINAVQGKIPAKEKYMLIGTQVRPCHIQMSVILVIISLKINIK